MSEISTKSAVSTRRAVITKITCTAVMTALAVVLMYLEIPLPFMPPFLKFDFSEVPVLVGSFALGPVYGVIIELLKNLIHLPATGTMGIGEASNFLTGSIYVFTAGSIYKKLRTRKGAVISMAVATLALAVIACPLNFFVTLPLYGSVLNFSTEAIIGMSNAVNPLITSKMNLILWGFLPFNLFKGIVVSFITFWVYKPISNMISKIYNKTH
jgi:riboflavin transporter FmnP